MQENPTRLAVSAYYEATRRMDQEAWVATFAPDGLSRLFEGPPARGHDALRRVFRGFIAPFERIGLWEDRVSIDGQNAVAYWTAQATTPSGKAIAFQGVDAFEVDPQGKITLHWACWDTEAVLSQL